jgi:hypothetical protein
MYVCLSVCLSVRPHGIARLAPDGFSWSLIFEYFSKICRENPSFITSGQEHRVLCMKTNIHLSPHLPQFFLEREMFQTNVVEKIKTHILYSITFFFRKLCRLWDNVENNVQPERSQMTIWCMRISCWIPKATHTHHMLYLLFFECNNGYSNTPELHYARKLPVLLNHDFISHRYLARNMLVHYKGIGYDYYIFVWTDNQKMCEPVKPNKLLCTLLKCEE